MGSSISHFYFIRSVLHLASHIRKVLSRDTGLPQEVVSELAYQTHLDRDRIQHMFRVFLSLANSEGRLTPAALQEGLPGWSTNPLRPYLRRALFDRDGMCSFPQLAKRVALFCPESKFSPVNNETRANEAALLVAATRKYDRYVIKRLLLMFRLTDSARTGFINVIDLARLIRCLLKTTIPDDTGTIIPEKIITEVARVTIVNVHERNEALCWAVCRSRNPVAAAYEEEAVKGVHRLVITKEMFLSELCREEFV